MNETTRDSANISILSLTYVIHADINLPAFCWSWLRGMMVVRMLGRQRCMKRRWNWGNNYKRLPVLRYTWSRIRFDGSPDRISPCNAIDSLLLEIWSGMPRGISSFYLYLLHLDTCSETFKFSDSFHPDSYHCKLCYLPVNGLFTWAPTMNELDVIHCPR